MFDKMLLPLLLTEKLGRVYGKTRFQKLIFLIQKTAEKQNVKNPQLKYELYLHGPFSFELSNIIDSLVWNDYLEQEIEPTRAGYPVHVYSLTQKGKTILKFGLNKKLISNRLYNIIENTSEKYGSLHLSDLVEKAYAEFGVKWKER